MDECKPLVAGGMESLHYLLEKAWEAGAYTRPLFGST